MTTQPIRPAARAVPRPAPLTITPTSLLGVVLGTAMLTLLALAPLTAQTGAPANARADAQPPLQLVDVLAAVDTAGFGGRAARSDARAADANRTAAAAAFLPSARVEAGSARTTDPIGVFGARLRQRAVTAADFDPARLNRPDPLTVTTAALVLEQPLLAPQGYLARRAASLGAEAAHAATDRVEEVARFEATRAFFGAVLAAASLHALDSSVVAAESHVRQAASLERNGMVTHSDVLLAEVRLRELEARRATARGNVAMARLALAVHMGTPGDTSRPLPAALPGAEPFMPADASGDASGDATGAAWSTDVPAAAPLLTAAGADVSQVIGARSDVRAAQLGVRAARAAVQQANARWLPTVGAVLRSDWASTSQPFGGAPFWTVGVMASIPVFSGGPDVADRQRAVAQYRAAESRADGAAAQAALEATQAGIERAVAAERLAIAGHALTQSREALRLVQRRYDGGLAAVTELLDASAARTAAELATASARHDLLIAVAAERIALGLDLSPLLDLPR